MRSERIDAIYSTSPPESAHLLACALKHFTGAPWIMDLRDPWTLEPLRWYLREGGARLALERRIESYAFGRADAIIVNTEEAAAAYRERYPGAAGRISTITNGWDAADFAAARAGSVVLRGEGDRGGAMYVAADRPDGGDRTAEETSAGEGRSRRFIVSHVGTFSRHVDEPAWPRAFFEAVRRLLDAGILSTRTFRVVLAGGMHPAAEREIDRLGLGSVLDRRGRVPHEEALRIMVRSDLLLLFDPSPEARYFIRGKLYEYLAAGAWILGLVQHGASRRLLERSGQAVILSPEDSGGIESVLARFVAERSRPARSGVFELEAFESASLTAALARVLGNAIRKGG
jgi:glycosyltransferase involved in cell wall biosynthesis